MSVFHNVLRSPRSAALAFLAVLAWTWQLYAPGLTGFFLFDDFPNLAPLVGIQADPTLDEALVFILHGVSSPTGRPLSLATFAIQAFDWPTNPGGFLRVNLLIHLLNGALLCWAMLRLVRLLDYPPSTGTWLAVAVTALWLAAPLQVTAVIYVIQRMTELSATFAFIGLALYFIGRERALRGRTSGLGWMTAGALVGGVVGVFAKENAVLFPLLLGVVEFTLLARVPRPLAWKPWAAVFIGVPAAVVGAYLLAGGWVFADAYSLRDFNLPERLMTQARALMMYLYKLVLPWPSAVRLQYDDFAASRGLFNPATTIVSIGAIVALVAAAVKWRRACPLFSFAVLWFFVSHLLESTTIPLELVFEHRNYQASVGIWFALAAAAPALWPLLPTRRIRALLAAALAAYFLLLSSVTWQITSLWGQPMLMADWWSQKLPDSKRARLEFVAALIGYRLPEVADTVVNDAIAQWPDHPAFYLLKIRVHCQFPESSTMPPLEPILASMRTMRSEQFTAIHLVDSVLKYVEEGQCPEFTPVMARRIVEAAFGNPTLERQRRNLLLLYARALRTEGRKLESLDRLREAVEIHPLIELIAQAIVLEIDAGRIDRAREYLVIAESDPRVSAADRWSHRKNLDALRTLLDSLPSGSGTAAVGED